MYTTLRASASARVPVASPTASGACAAMSSCVPSANVKCTCCEGNKGGFADYIRIADGDFAFAIPDACDSAKTAPLLCGGQTVWTPLRQQTKAGDKVGILGLGGLGHMAIKFARALGCTVTALSGSVSKADEALAMLRRTRTEDVAPTLWGWACDAAS